MLPSLLTLCAAGLVLPAGWRLRGARISQAQVGMCLGQHAPGGISGTSVVESQACLADSSQAARVTLPGRPQHVVHAAQWPLAAHRPVASGPPSRQGCRAGGLHLTQAQPRRVQPAEDGKPSWLPPDRLQHALHVGSAACMPLLSHHVQPAWVALALLEVTAACTPMDCCTLPDPADLHHLPEAAHHPPHEGSLHVCRLLARERHQLAHEAVH